jgi:hypothetical protein
MYVRMYVCMYVQGWARVHPELVQWPTKLKPILFILSGSNFIYNVSLTSRYV